MGPTCQLPPATAHMDPSDQNKRWFNGSSVPGVSTLTLVTPLTHLYPPDPPYRPKHAPKRNPMANPDPTESSHTPSGSIAPMQWCQWCRWYRFGTTFWPILEYPVSGSIELAAILEYPVSGSIALWPQSQYGASMILPPHPQNFLRAFGAAHTNLTLRRPKSGDGR